MGFIYLASPYTDPSYSVMEQRYREAAHATASLLSKGQWVYSPIVHCHEIAQMYDLPREFDFWQAYNFAMLERADKLLLLRAHGWEASRGMRAELEFAKARGIPWDYTT